MKKLFRLLVVLFILFYSFQVLFVYIGNGHTVDYKIEDDGKIFLVHEEFKSNDKKDKNNYYLRISMGDTIFDILTYEDFKRSSEIVKKIKYFEDDNYKCIFVKYRNNLVLNDVLCNDGNYTIPYHSIEAPSVELKTFVAHLLLENYDEKKWVDNKLVDSGNDIVSLYNNNMIQNHFVGILMNNSLYRFNYIENIGNNNLSQNEIGGIKLFINDKFVTLDYKDKNIMTSRIYYITSSEYYDLSYNEKITSPVLLGSYNDSVFIYDKASKEEYEIDTKSKKILEVGSGDTTIKYYMNGEWKNDKISNIDVENLDFGSEYDSNYSNNNFDKTIKVGNKSGFYYYFKFRNNMYDIYRSTFNNKNNLTYLLTVTSIKNVQFVDDFVYYIDKNSLKYYSDNYGYRTLLKSILINEDTIFKVFIDKSKET